MSAAPDEYVRIVGGAALPPGTARAVTAGRYDVAVFNVAGTFYALENSCPHQGGPIADGWLENAIITCPWHGWCFDVRSGKMTLGNYAMLPRFAVRTDGGDLLVSMHPIEEEKR